MLTRSNWIIVIMCGAGVLLESSGLGTPLRKFVMGNWSPFLTEGYFFWRLAFLINLGGCGSSSFLTFLGPKLGGLFFSGLLLSKICFSGTLSTAPLLHTLSLLSSRGCVIVSFIGVLTRSNLALGTSAWAARLTLAPPPRALLWLLIGGSDSRAAEP